MSSALINICWALMGVFVGIAGTTAFIEWRKHIKLKNHIQSQDLK